MAQKSLDFTGSFKAKSSQTSINGILSDFEFSIDILSKMNFLSKKGQKICIFQKNVVFLHDFRIKGRKIEQRFKIKKRFDKNRAEI